MKRIIPLLLLVSCYQSAPNLDPVLVSIQIQDRNGMTETISQPDRLETYEHTNFLASQPYKKVLRVFRHDGKQSGVITSYHPNGHPWQYLEAQDMRAFGAFREWHPNGRLKIEAQIIGGTADIAPSGQKDWLFDGESKIWDERGVLLANFTYNKGVLEGKTSHYYPSGVLKQDLTYLQNELEGIAIEYYADGKEASRTQYLKGVKNGSSIGYHPDQTIRFRETYQDGLLIDGEYFRDGILISEVKGGFGFQAGPECLVEVRNGKFEGAVKFFYPNGDLKIVYHVKNGLKQGEEIEYYDGKAPKISIPWEGNLISGIVKTWYNDGKLQSQREMSRNKKMGSSLAWYRDGSLMYMEEYEEDKLTSGQYYKKGTRDPISNIANGNGFATLYDEYGIFLRKVHYQKGKPIDPES